MNKVVVDTSAILAYLFNETGAELIEQILEESSCLISSVNYTELASKLVDKGMPIADVIVTLESLELEFIAQDSQQALINAELRPLSKPYGLSLGDRACLALGILNSIPVITADRVWKEVSNEIEIQVIR
ncbi:type II toxin-antitoxin system VapC family toxin [Thiofilum flexile]|uniref:type II toxin-antitoxin system VapC family toxin n=1 Tax=Thiofilum flexile TaxID=125627 RepID=UPI00035F5B73|nr:type II toxin-antitoxin system VapC family toxin [Thiofilum flexile]